MRPDSTSPLNAVIGALSARFNVSHDEARSNLPELLRQAPEVLELALAAAEAWLDERRAVRAFRDQWREDAQVALVEREALIAAGGWLH